MADSGATEGGGALRQVQGGAGGGGPMGQVVVRCEGGSRASNKSLQPWLDGGSAPHPGTTLHRKLVKLTSIR